MRKFKKFYLLVAFAIAAMISQGCMLPSTQAQWKTGALPSIKAASNALIDVVIETIPGMATSFAEDLMNLIPNLLNEGRSLMGLGSQENKEVATPNE
jgi:hypothetical protein